MNCREALQLMYEYLDNELTEDTVTKVRRHLSICEHCFGKFEFEKHLNECLSLKGQVAVDAAPLRARVIERISELENEEGRPNRDFFSRFRPYLAVAAAVALVVVGFALVFDGGRSTAYAKVKPLVENHRRCMIDRENGSLMPMDESAIRACVAGLISDPDILLKPAPDRQPVFGQVVDCAHCHAAHVAFEYADSEVSIYIFADKNYAPPQDYRIIESGNYRYHCGSFDGMNIVYWKCKGCWCAAVSAIDLAQMISFASAY